MLVQNLNGTGDISCHCSSWLDHWEKYNPSGRYALFCAARDCNNIAKVGAHVKKYRSADMHRYIVPLCHECNQRAGSIDIGDTPLASANVAETCGK